jgi:hypothetical protein
MILTPENVTPRCTCTMELASQVERPYKFRVTVIGEYPHAYRRAYTVVVPGDIEAASNGAALKAMELFCDEARRLPGVTTVVPRARLA